MRYSMRRELIEFARREDLIPYFREVESEAGPVMRMEGRDRLMLGSVGCLAIDDRLGGEGGLRRRGTGREHEERGEQGRSHERTSVQATHRSPILFVRPLACSGSGEKSPHRGVEAVATSLRRAVVTRDVERPTQRIQR